MNVRARGTLLALGLVVTSVGVAQAGAAVPPTPEQVAARDAAVKAAFATAEALERKATTSQLLADFQACGEAYMVVFATGFDEPVVDESLYDGGVCFETAGSVGQALQAYKQLRARFATSPMFGPATLRSGRLYARVGMFAEAAALLREYGLRFATAADAADALSDAVYYFRVLGQADDAIDTTKKFIVTYGAKQPAKAAEAFFNLEAIYAARGDADLRIKHLRQYIGTYAKAGSPDNLLVAYATIADLVWQSSCPVTLVDGTCAKRGAVMPVAKRGAVATRCGQAIAGAAPRWPLVASPAMPDVVVARDARRTKDAVAAATQAVALWRDGKGFSNEGRVRAAYAGALLLLADAAYEATATPAFPTGLNFDPARPEIAKQSLQRFDAWLAAAQRTVAVARAAYQRVIEARDAGYALAASARIGDLLRSFARTLQTAEIPANVRKIPEAAAIYCTALTDVMAPLAASATEAYTLTLSKSTDLGLWTDASRHAEAALGLAPPSELAATPPVAAPPHDLEVPEYAARSLDAVTP